LLLAGLAALILAAGGGLWYATRAGWRDVNADVLAAVRYEDQQAAQGATNLLLNVQDRGNLDWLAVRRAEANAQQPAPLPLPTLKLGPDPAALTALTVLDTDYVQANVVRAYAAPDGQDLTFLLPQFYRHGSDGAWLRSAPPGSFWGEWLDWNGANLDIRYSERDAAFVNSVGGVLDQRLAEACAAWAGGCAPHAPIKLYLSGFVGSLEYDPLANVEVRILVDEPDGSVGAPSDYFLSIPSPQIAGIPADAAARSYLTDYLAVRLIAELARHVSSPAGYLAHTAQAIQALGLTRVDPGYLTSGRHNRGPAGGANADPSGNQTSDNTNNLIWILVDNDPQGAGSVQLSLAEKASDRLSGLSTSVGLIAPTVIPPEAEP
jgi:hypothetical protein